MCAVGPAACVACSPGRGKVDWKESDKRRGVIYDTAKRGSFRQLMSFK